ncbi:MAG: FeoB small GTPase domain-containing protein [Phycisphaerae bacterium]
MPDCGSCSGRPSAESPSAVALTIGGRHDFVVALAGNPNTGKSTVFNHLTGLRQHTGNWPGKTVARAEGSFEHAGSTFKLVDLPGTYSLLADSIDEQVARDFILFGNPDCTIVVCDATVLERNLGLALQILQITDRVVVCANLIDEANRKKIALEARVLEEELGVPVVPTAARRGQGLDHLINHVHEIAAGRSTPQPIRLEFDNELEPAVAELAAMLTASLPGLKCARWIALRLLAGDERMREMVATGELRQLIATGGRGEYT